MHESSYWRRFSRRRLMTGAGALGALVSVGGLAACGDDTTKSSTSVPATNATVSANVTAGASASSAAAAAKPGGTFLYVYNYGGILDPQFSSTPQAVDAWFGDPFLKVANHDRSVSPGVIEKWEQPDKSTTILHVRQGVKFFNMPPANGRNMEAKDIVYTIRSMTGSAFPDAKIPFPRKGLFVNVNEPEAVDPNTVRLTTTSPRSDLILSLAEYRNAVIPEGLRESFGGYDSLLNPAPNRLVGTGPFICKALDLTGLTTWERNPEYWQKPYPYIDGVTVNFGDSQRQAVSFIAGQSDMVQFGAPADIDTLKKGLPNGQYPQYPLNAFYQLAFNTRKKPLDDPRVRGALAIMFDKPGFSKIYVGAQHWPSPLPWGYSEALPQDELKQTLGVRSPSDADIAEARKMLDAAGVGPFSIGHTSPVDLAGVSAFKAVGEHWKSQVEKYLPGVSINIAPTTYASMLALLPKTDQWDSYAAGPSQEMTAIQMLQVTTVSNGARNFTGWVSQSFDGMIQTALAEFDDAKRTQILRDAQRLVLKEWPMFMTHQGPATLAISPKLHNLDVGGVGFHEHWVRYANYSA
jgi:peptide/nickel transport system substrate-binding protein